jgi:hypothetical protein
VSAFAIRFPIVAPEQSFLIPSPSRAVFGSDRDKKWGNQKFLANQNRLIIYSHLYLNLRKILRYPSDIFRVCFLSTKPARKKTHFSRPSK